MKYQPPVNDFVLIKRKPVVQNVTSEMEQIKCQYGYGYKVNGEPICGLKWIYDK